MDEGDAIGIDMFNLYFPVDRLKLNKRGKELSKDAGMGAIGNS